MGVRWSIIPGFSKRRGPTCRNCNQPCSRGTRIVPIFISGGKVTGLEDLFGILAPTTARPLRDIPKAVVATFQAGALSEFSVPPYSDRFGPPRCVHLVKPRKLCTLPLMRRQRVPPHPPPKAGVRFAVSRPRSTTNR